MIWEPYIPGSLGGQMQCPTCRHHTPDSWSALVHHLFGEHVRKTLDIDAKPPRISSKVSLDYMYCANPECKELVVRLHETLKLPTHAVADPEMLTRSWFIYPRNARRPIDPLVPDPFKQDYAEATAILDSSPRMSAVLSRRILADLLETYANHSQFKLSERIDKFTADKSHPSGLRENLHHFREIADFGAHTQKNDQAEIIEVSKEEAEWTLDLLDRLFDHFIVAPEKDRLMRESMDSKLQAAGRKEIDPPDGEVTS
jgi:hypothetical protein